MVEPLNDVDLGYAVALLEECARAAGIEECALWHEERARRHIQHAESTGQHEVHAVRAAYHESDAASLRALAKKEV